MSCREPSAEEHARYSSAAHLLCKLASREQTQYLESTGSWAVMSSLSRDYPDAFPPPYDLMNRLLPLSSKYPAYWIFYANSSWA